MAMKQRLDIHNFDERLRSAESKVDAQNPISARNAQLIREKPKLNPRICPRCKATNAYDAKFCMKCGLALDVKAAFEMEEARKTLAKKFRQHGIST
jgi:ribosomal protein L40E